MCFPDLMCQRYEQQKIRIAPGLKLTQLFRGLELSCNSLCLMSLRPEFHLKVT
jgi:hypothetical protein